MAAPLPPPSNDFVKHIFKNADAVENPCVNAIRTMLANSAFKYAKLTYTRNHFTFIANIIVLDILSSTAHEYTIVGINRRATSFLRYFVEHRLLEVDRDIKYGIIKSSVNCLWISFEDSAEILKLNFVNAMSKQLPGVGDGVLYTVDCHYVPHRAHEYDSIAIDMRNRYCLNVYEELVTPLRAANSRVIEIVESDEEYAVLE